MNGNVGELSETRARERRGTSAVGKAERLFRTSALVLAAIAVVIIFGNLYRARTLYGGNPATLTAYNAMLLKGMTGGILVLQVGILLALYGLLARIFSRRPAGYAPNRNERFLKMASLAFSAGAAAVLLCIMFLHGRRIALAAKLANPQALRPMIESAEALVLQSYGVASFFLLLAMLSLVLLGLQWQDRRAQ